jgi:hypothetical protein
MPKNVYSQSYRKMSELSSPPITLAVLDLVNHEPNYVPPATRWSTFGHLDQQRFQFCFPWHQLTTFWSPLIILVNRSSNLFPLASNGYILVN